MFKKVSLVRLNLILCIAFGIAMGVLFPLFASLFVEYKSLTAKRLFVCCCLGAGVIVGLCAYCITCRTILRHLKGMDRQMSGLTLGDADLTRRFPVVSDDVIGHLPGHVNRFLENISRLIGLAQTNFTRITRMGPLLEENMNQTQAAVSRIGETIILLQGANARQEENVAANREAGENLNRVVLGSITHVLELFNQMNALTDQMFDQASLIEAILGQLEETSRSIEGAAGDGGMNLNSINHRFILLTEKNMEQVDGVFSELGNFVRTIEEISNRTGVLAINASIEAARSGRSGEGFKVIAQEIRKLSSEAENASSLIRSGLELNRETIGESKRDLQVSAGEVKRSLEKTVGSINDLKVEAGKVKTNTDRVQGNYSHVTELLKQIRSSLNRLQDSSGRSREIMDALDHSKEEMKEGVERIGALSAEIEKMARRTGRQIDLMSLSLNEASEQMTAFKTERNDDEADRRDPG